MTGDLTVFKSYSPCLNNYTVRIADGTLSKVMGKGSVIISQNITLNSVLYVPKLDCNLLSIFSQGNIVPNPKPIDDIDIPIALRKGVRSCTQHPIEKYVSYGKLSKGYRSFVAALDSTNIPRNVQ
uniref:Retrovirus-related Pol polyprotein from transposon TNT 1-94-like beta-barrel domain-containing protein n=1 Tax=Cajanus cajan TaxID=3821 RepID=A0A151SUR6_CAJCA|nr:hypothetical protein KK1_013922 [Cajanus cajan]